MTLRFTLVLLAAIAGAQSELPPEVLDLARIRAEMRANSEQLPRYTCLETIERSHRDAHKSTFQLVDTLRIEVTRIGREESYSWPQARRFASGVDEIIGSGTISTGEYSAHAYNVFVNSASQIRFAGRETYKGRPALKYDYRLASFASGWTLTYAGKSGRVSAYGSFWADADTLELLRLDSHADEIPADLRYTAVVSQIEYARVKIGDTVTLLPQSAELLLDLRGSKHRNSEPGFFRGHVDVYETFVDGQNRNDVEFSQCRPYTTQSKIRFDAEPSNSNPPPPGIQELALPSNLSIRLDLTEPVDSQSAKEGDLIHARVAADVKLKRQVLVPKGAAVLGRIRRLEHYSDPDPHFIVGLELVEIEAMGKRWIFGGYLDRVDPLPGLTWYLNPKYSEIAEAPKWLAFRITREKTVLRPISGVGFFFMDGTRFQLPAGLHMIWRTSDDPAPRR